MSDDFDRLRRTMSELSEHGGSTDLYDRTLQASRRMTRRRHTLAGGAVAAAVLAIAVPVALAGLDRAAPPPVADIPATSPAPAPSRPSPSPSPSSSSPAPTRPSSSPPVTGTSSRSVTSRGTGKPPATGCPVSAATLRRAADLPDGWRINAADVKCVEGWADARPTAPTEAEQGDGVILFRWADGKWKLVTEGSAIECASHGVPRSIGRRLSACYYD